MKEVAQTATATGRLLVGEVESFNRSAHYATD